MIRLEIHRLILMLLFDPEGFTLKEMKDLERKLAVYEKAKAMGLDVDLIEDQLMVAEGVSVEVL